MAATFTLAGSSVLMNQHRLIYGTAQLSNSYIDGSETLDLSNYISGSTSPVVQVVCSAGYVSCSHDGGTASAGVIQAYDIENNAPYNNVDLSSVYCTVIAIGEIA